MIQSKNIFLIATDKQSKLYHWIGNDTYKGGLRLRKLSGFCEETSIGIKNQHIYITSDEEIKEGDWWLNIKTNDVDKCTYKSEVSVYNSQKYQHIKKIILTTDQDLIKDGVQAIDDEFSEWFVKNPSCERVEVKKGFADGSAYGYDFLSYKIIIPKEEPIRKIDTCYNFDMKIGCVQDICRCEQEVYDRAYQPISLSEVDKEEPKQETTLEEHYLAIPNPLVDVSRMKVDNHPDINNKETLEEAMRNNGYHESDYDKIWREGVEFGVKWQSERMYSEEEMYSALQKLRLVFKSGVQKWQEDFEFDLDKWFEQFKKK